MSLSKSQAHYIKAVYELSGNGNGARVIDISEKLDLSKASVSLAMTKLARQGLIRKDAQRHICLTEKGEREAMRMLDKFEVIRRFLVDVLDVEKDAAGQDACAMEHVISMDTLCAICRFTGTMVSTNACPVRCPIAYDAKKSK